MATSGSKRNKGGTTTAMINQNELIYQAVIIADSYNKNFYPFTKYSPRVLFPLVNVPLLQYTLGCLNSSGIQVVYLFCTEHAEEIKNFVSASKFSSPSSPMQVSVIVSKDCLSFGDAMRELDNRGLIRGDFVLLTGDVVSNVRLKKFIDDHRERYKLDKRTLMTMLAKQAAPKHRTRCPDEDYVVVVDSKTQRVLHHQKLEDARKIELDLSIFAENNPVNIHYDLLDSSICICSALVLPLFSDNFDFQTRDDFVKGILENEEILGNIIFLQVLRDEYAARVTNFHTYDAVSKDVIGRWAYPFVPDINFFDSKPSYSYLRNNIYRKKDVTLARTCELLSSSVIGSNTEVGNNSKIIESVIGNDCVIGDNVIIKNSYIWDNVTIHDNCIIESSILANGVYLFENVVMSAVSIVSYNVVLGPSVKLAENTVLTAEPLNEDDEFNDTDNASSVKVDKSLVGREGKGFKYEGMEQEMRELMTYFKGIDISSDEDNASMSDLSESDIQSDDDNPLLEDSKQFYKEVLDSLLRAVDEKIPSENIVLEINSSKHAYNISVKEVNMLVVKAIFDLPSIGKTELQPQEYFKSLRNILNQFLSLLRNYMKSIDSQKDCLISMEEYAIAHLYFAPCFMGILRFLYEKEILLEEAILSWFHEPASNLEEIKDHETICSLVHPFITWLQEAEEESD